MRPEPGRGGGMVPDHLVICAETLDAGAAWVAERLGVAPGPGGQHPAMGTHNRLLSLGPGFYLEVIAVDPQAPAPGRVRWFGLDDFAGAPVLRHWVARCDDLTSALRVAPDGSGAPLALARGDLRWEMAVPGDGMLPFGGVFPGLIEWKAGGHPADRLADVGCRLRRLTLLHPEAGALAAALAAAGLDDVRIAVASAAAPAMRAEIDTPAGLRHLG